MAASRATTLLIGLGVLLLLLLPALANGTMLLFPDSIGYYRAGAAALETLLPATHIAEAAALPRPVLDPGSDGVTTSRSAYYGLGFVLLQRIGGDWALPLVQSLLVLGSLVLALPRLAGVDARGALLASALIAVVGGAGMFTVTAMPDVFSGLMMLALAMLIGFWPQQRLAERGFWLVLVVASCLFHKANLAIATVVVALHLAALLWRRPPASAFQLPVLLVAALLLALAGHTAVSRTVERVTGQSPQEAPFLLARTIADGPGERWLRKVCPGAGLALCAHLDRMPISENDFLWSDDPDIGLLKAVPPAERRRIADESGRVILGTLRSYPIEQITASLGNTARQFFTVGVTEFALGPKAGPERAPGLGAVLRAYPDTPAGRGLLPFGLISSAMLAGYGVSLVLLAIAMVRLAPGRGAPWPPQLVVFGWLVVGVVVNAAVSGVLAGVFDRYQGRVAWLIVMAAVAAWLMLRARSRLAAGLQPLRAAP